MRFSLPWVVLAACVAMASPMRVVVAQDAGAPPPGFSKTEIEIPMRDGVHLNTDIYVPVAARGVLPIMFIRTPYGIVAAANALRNSYLELEADGYIFVFQDIRGRYKSEGQFVMMRPPRDSKDPHAVDESTDAYDTIDWLVKHVPNNNGRVGMMGVSYPGWLTVMAMLDPHPALKAVSPQASPADMYLGDDFHHNGAFRLSYGLEYATRMETNKEQASFAFDRSDTYDWYLQLGGLANVNSRYLHGAIPTWNDFAAHPELRCVLAAAGGDPVHGPCHAADPVSRGVVGPGGLLRPGHDLRGAGAPRHRSPQLPGRGALEPWRVDGA